MHSARYAGDEASFTDNNRKLLGELDGIADAERGACFICVMALCDGDQRLYHTEGICPGSISQSIRGERGFGYDPLFVPEGESRTFAELSAPEKDCISHRGRALTTIRQAVRDGRYFESGDVVSPQQWLRSRALPPPPDPVEDGRDYLENATIKAIAFSRWSGLPALADDSGLEVAAVADGLANCG